MHFKNARLQFSSSIEKQTRDLLVTYVYQQSFMSQIASLFCATILFIGLLNFQHPNIALYGWFAYVVLVALFRVGIIWLYQMRSSEGNEIIFWKNLFIVGALLGGLGWGFAGSYLFWFASSIQQTLIVLIMSGIMAGAVPVLAADLAASIAFIVTTLLPLIIQLIFNQQNYVYSLFSVAVTAYFIYMMVLAMRSHRLFKETIGLRFEKEGLVHQLSETSAKLDVAGRKLNLVETHDLITGLANRKLFMVALMGAIKRAEISQKNIALFYIDLDNFKFVNDAYGYEVGDQLLKLITKRMKENLREVDTLARVGGDELAIVLENQTNISNISQIAKQICQLLTKAFTVDSYHINISASIGVSIYPIDGIEGDTLVKKAEKAMQYIKEHGHNNFRFSTIPIE